MDAAEQRSRQDAIIAGLVLLVRQLIGRRGIPVTDEERIRFARALYPRVQQARQQSYALAARQIQQQADAAGLEPPVPAPIREYRPQALVTLLEQAVEDDVTTVRQVEENVDELDTGSRRSARRRLREPVTEHNRRDPQVVDIVTRRATRAVARHAEMAGRHAIIDTVDQADPLPRSGTSVTVDGEPTRRGTAVDVAPRQPRQAASVEGAGRSSGRRPRDRRRGRRPAAEPLPGTMMGWARVLTGRESCSFCAMLASRGPVYRSESTASSNAQGKTFHFGCDCVAMPVFKDRDWEGREEYERLEGIWAESTVGASGKDARKAFGRAFAQARAENPERFVPASMRGEQAPDPSTELDTP